jgi:hypothetical protein
MPFSVPGNDFMSKYVEGVICMADAERESEQIPLSYQKKQLSDS